MAITTKLPRTFAATTLALLTLATGALAQAVTVDKPKIEITIQKTPRFSVNGAKEKRDTQKDWIEVEVEFKADQRGGNPNVEFIEELEFKYFITITPKTGEKDRKVYTTTINHANIEKGAQLYSVAYMSPITIAKIIGKDKAPSKADVDVAVEIRHQGKLIAGDATKSPRSKWWNSMSQSEGQVLPKSETPFAWLWFDRYPETK